MSIPGSASPLFFTAAADAAAFTLEKSVRFNKADSPYLNRTMSGGDRGKATISCWLKKCNIHSVTSEYIYLMGISASCSVYISSNDKLHFDFYHTDGSTWAVLADSDMLFRDVSAWYHIVVSIDSSAGTTNADRVKLYVNGVQQDFTFTTYGSGTITGDIKHLNQSGQTFQINSRPTKSYYGNFYLANYHYIDGQALDPTDFGAFDDNGVWQAAAYSGTFGTNGFHLFDFANESGIGNDSSGNDNDFTVNNISSTAGAGNDVLRDVPTNGDSSDDTGAGGEVSGNYCTWSPLAGTNVTLSNGNLDCSLSAGTASKARTTIAVTSGKYYWEIKFKSGNYGMIGISDASLAGGQISYAAGALNYYVQNGTLYGDVGGSFSGTSYGSALSANDVLGVALDMDNGNVKFYKNGSDLGNANTTSLVGKTIMPHLGEAGGATFVTEANFGARSFAYSAPSGFKALCTTNLPTPTIANGRDHFDTKLYTGNGSSQSITGYNFSPNFVWLKSRSAATLHTLQDTVRGANKALEIDGNQPTPGEITITDSITSFNSDGFSLGSRSTVNDSSETYVAWAWNIPGSASSNSDGTITSSVTKNADAGVSIVTWTGTNAAGTVGHGLGSKPDLIVVKVYGDSSYNDNWPVYSSAFDGTKYAYLNDTRKFTTYAGFWNDGTATSTVFPVGDDNSDNGKSLIAYCFTSVAGFSAFGTYVGLGGAGEPFVHTGFAVKFLMIKRSDSSGEWAINDAVRNTFNPASNALFPDRTSAEDATRHVDLLSNGFKLKNSSPIYNSSGGSYVYMALASNPFQANGGLAR